MSKLGVGDIVRVVSNCSNMDSLIGVVLCLYDWPNGGDQWWAKVDFPMDACRYYHTSSLVQVGHVD